MKKIFVAIILIALVSAFGVYAGQSTPSITLNGARVAKSGFTLVDGLPVTLGWTMNNAPVGTVTEIRMVAFLGGQESWGYSITENDRNPVTGRCSWIPRAIQGVQNLYRIRVIWKTALVGTVIATAETPTFRINSREMRCITLQPPTSDAAVNGKALIQFNWSAKGLPAGAKIQIVAQPSWNSEMGGIIIATTSDTGGFMWWVGDCSETITPGQYIVTAYWVTDCGVFGLASNNVLLNLPVP
jgi:hypothetical protein